MKSARDKHLDKLQALKTRKTQRRTPDNSDKHLVKQANNRFMIQDD